MKAALRKEMLQRRRALSRDERREFSREISRRLSQLPEYKRARTVLLYRALWDEAEIILPEADKRFAFPLCVGEGEMIALEPLGEDSWQEGYRGIMEPVRERSREVAPEEIDLVVCPCAAFDRQLHRLGMGKGFYDRYLPRCTKAAVVALAFEAQRAESVPVEKHDMPVMAVISEKKVYRNA